MTLDLEPQVRDYTEFFVSTTRPIELEEILETRIGSEPVRPLQRRPRRRGVPHWVYGVATAVVVLAVVGGLALLLNFLGGSEAPVEDEPPLESTTTIAPTTSLPEESTQGFLPVEPTGTGPELSFVAVNAPPGLVRDVAWFRDAFYALTADETLHRSPDGIVWEEVTSFDAGWSDEPSAPHPFGEEHPPSLNLLAGADRLVAVRAFAATEPRVVLGVGELEEAEGVFEHVLCDEALLSAGLDIAVSTDGNSWAASRIPFDLPASEGACTSVELGAAAAGPSGILVSATVWVDVDYHSIIAAHLGLDVARSITGAPSVIDGEIRFRTSGGINRAIPLEEVGLSEELVTSRGGNAVAWWSSDGPVWQEVVGEGPMRSDGLRQLVATDTGFLAAGGGLGLFATEDGTSWEVLDLSALVSLEDWDGSALVVEHGPASSSLIRYGSSAPLPANEGFDGFVDLAAGGAGIVGIATSLDGTISPLAGGEPLGEPVFREPGVRQDLVFSPDGLVWRRWTPTELEGAPIRAVWVGRDRVLILTHDDCCEDGSGAVAYPPTLWVGRPE